jgi:glutamine amidotransferase
MKIVIIKYNAGNIRSVSNALQRLGYEAEITDNADAITSAGKVIFPGVGEASSTMRYLKERGLDSIIKSLKQPVLGICLGMQLMCSHSEEGNTDCLGIFDQPVVRFRLDNNNPQAFKIPHMGWNTITDTKSSLFDANHCNSHVYFVHSYYVPVGIHTIAKTDHIVQFSAALNKDNFYATQFHPEKSGDNGERILKNFLLST